MTMLVTALPYLAAAVLITMPFLAVILAVPVSYNLQVFYSYHVL